nr:hypothetical protein [Tanacetum cinerariifolium]
MRCDYRDGLFEVVYITVQECKVVVCSGIERGFLSQKCSGGWRGVKEKSANVLNIEAFKEKDLNDEYVAMKVKSPLVDHTNAVKTCRGSYPPLPTQGPPSVGNTPGNGIDVVVPVESIRAIIERFVNTAYGFFLDKRVAYPVVANYVRNTWVWVKLYGVPITAFSKDGLSAIVTKLAKNLKKPSQTSRGVSVDPKVGFKPHKEYRPVLKKPTASPSGNKKQKGVTYTNEEDLLIDWQVILMDEAGNPLKNVKCPGDYDSEDEVASDDNDMARSLVLERVGFGTQSLLEQ